MLGALANGMVASENDDTRLLRSLTGEIPAPLPVGRATIVVSPVRRGSGASTVMARIEADGIVCGVATGVLGRARGFEATLAPPRPPPPAFASAQEVPVGPPFGPGFATMLEYRPTGPLPFTGVEPAVCEGRVRVRERGAVLRFADLVCLADAYWPAVFTRLAAPRLADIDTQLSSLGAVDPEQIEKARRQREDIRSIKDRLENNLEGAWEISLPITLLGKFRADLHDYLQTEERRRDWENRKSSDEPRIPRVRSV